jgi:signal transduction histidine kinase
MTAMLADKVGLGRDQLMVEDWHEVPAFLLVAATYYNLTNSLVAIVLSLSGQKPVARVFIDNAKFVLPAEFAVCGIGGLVTIVWLQNPAWAPLVLFPVVVSQVAYVYVSSSKHQQTRLAFIAEAGRVLGLSLDPHELAERSVRLCVPDLGDAALLWLIQDDGSLTLAAQAVADGGTGSALVQPDATTPVAASSMRLAQQTISGQRTSDGSTTAIVERVHGSAATTFRSARATIVRSPDRILGVLVLFSASNGSYTSGLVGVVEELAQRCAAGLANAYLHAEAQRATHLRDEFLSVAAHELKTPVTSLRGYAQLLQKGDTIPPQMLAKGLHTIEVQSDRLMELTRKLLDVSRIDSGKLQLEVQQTDLSALVRDAVVQAQGLTDRHTLQIATPRPCQAWLDPLRIEQVIANLVGNAIKYSPNGGTIAITVERVGSGAVRVAVRDHGLGIPPERRGRLFDRLYQAHGNGYLSGLGLGLFISKQIVELHGGSIDAHFPADGGTCMIVMLPIKQPQRGDAALAR